MEVKVNCTQCNKEYIFDITLEQYKKYISGEDYIQNIFPEISPGLRELFISGICPDCWSKIFPKEENEE